MRITRTPPRPVTITLEPLPADDGVPGLLRAAWEVPALPAPPTSARLETIDRLAMWLDLAAAEIAALAEPAVAPDPCDYARFGEALDNLAGVTNLWRLSERARLAARR